VVEWGGGGGEKTPETCLVFSLSLSTEKVYEETRGEKEKKYKMSVECVDRRNNFAARKILLPDWWLGNYSIGLLRADN